MSQLTECCHPQFERRQLSGVDVNGDDFARPLAQHCESIVAGRSNRQASETGLNVQRLEQDISVFPALGVTNAGEVGALCHLTKQGRPP